MSIFSAALRVIGLSHSEASVFLSKELGRTVSEQTVKDMSAERSRVNPDVWDALRGLYYQMVTASEEALDLIHESQPDELDLTPYGKAGEWPSLRVSENARAMVALGSELPIID